MFDSFALFPLRRRNAFNLFLLIAIAMQRSGCGADGKQTPRHENRANEITISFFCDCEAVARLQPPRNHNFNLSHSLDSISFPLLSCHECVNQTYIIPIEQMDENCARTLPLCKRQTHIARA